MGGLGFIHPGFLAAAAAVAVPVAIHLLSRNRPRRVEIGSLVFLRAALREVAHRRRIRRWVLLAMRTAAVLLLAILFARPYLRAPEAVGSGREVVVLVDRSASMGAGAAGETASDRARQRADERIRGLPDGTSVRLAGFDADRVVPISAGPIDPALRPGLGGTDYARALAWARDVVIASRRPVRQVYLFTDLQRSGLRDPFSEGFPAGVDVEVVDVGRAYTANLAVEEVAAERTDLRAGRPVSVAARVFNAGAIPARDVRVRLAIEGRPAIERTTTVAGRSRQVVRFEVPIDRPGLYQGFVEVVGGDDLRFDDRRWLAFEARRPDRVLLVDGDPGPSVFGNETYYLETATRLELPDDASAEPPTPYEPVRLDRGAKGAPIPDLKPFSVVALCNVEDVSTAEANALWGFVQSGGGLVIFPGDRIKEGAYSAMERAGLLPARLLGPADAGSYRFAEWAKDHPLFRPFDDPQHGDLRTIRFRRIERLGPAPGSTVLAKAADGSPMVVERKVGSGRAILFAFPADNAWGDWPIHRLYVPIIQQVLGDLTGRLPESGRVRSLPAGEGQGEAPGVTVDDGRAIVRNVAPAESEIERTTAAKLREFYRLPEGRREDRQEADEAAALAAGGERPDELWRAIAWILLAVLIGELFVANRTYAS